MLFRMAKQKGVSPWTYVLQYWAAFILMAFTLGCVALNIWGPNMLNNEEAMKEARVLIPFSILYEVLTFIYFRKRIDNANVYYDDNDDTIDTPPSPKNKGEKKDLSYFR